VDSIEILQYSRYEQKNSHMDIAIEFDLPCSSLPLVRMYADKMALALRSLSAVSGASERFGSRRSRHFHWRR
jgi:hypothetical protein